MKLGLVRARAPATVAAAPTTPRSFTSTWENAVRRWLWGRSSTDLDEVAQEVFIRFSGYSDATLVRCPQTFVLKVAANVVDEWCGTPRNDWLDEKALEGKEGSGAENGKRKEKSVNRALTKQLQAAVDKLPSRQRQVLLMHVNEGLPYEEIAKRMKMTPRLVRRDLVRAYAGVRCGVGERALNGLS